MGGFENVMTEHNTQTAVEKLMEYDEFNNIGNADFIPDNKDIYDEFKTCYSDNDKLRIPVTFDSKDMFEESVLSDKLCSRAYIWEYDSWQKIK